MKKRRVLLVALMVTMMATLSWAQEFSITIDAQKDAWYDGLTGPDNGYIYLPARAATEIGAPDSNEDLSAFVWLAWDTTYLYVYGEVTDDILVVNAQEWANDAIELKIDPDPAEVDSTPGTAGSVVGARMSAFGEDNATCAPGTICWDNVNTGCQTGAFDCEMDTVTAITEEDYARTETNDGYAVEFRLPWTNVSVEGRSVDVGVGSTFGMAINLNDNDSNTREAQLQWSAGVADAVWNDVRLHGTVEFLPDNMLRMIPTNSSATSIQPCEFAENDSADAWYTPPTPGTGTTGEFSIAIDAEKDTWYDGLVGPDEGYIFIPSRASSVGFDQPTDDSDLSALFWVGWDTTYFYLYGEISDDNLVVNSTTGSWENDGVEVRMDGNPNVADQSPGSPGSVAGVPMTVFSEDDPRATGATNSMGGWTTVTEDDYARQDFAGGYSIEFRLPWAEVPSLSEGRVVNTVVDSIFGLAIAINDNDSEGREHQIQWAAVMDDATWRDTKMLGTAQFLADNKINLIAMNSAQCPPPEFVTNDSADVWYDPSMATSVDLFDDSIPETFNLEQNYPNPFNPETLIRYSLPKSEEVTVTIYNTMGQQVRTLVKGERQPAGNYAVKWDGRNETGARVASGVYLYRLSTKSTVVTKKMLLVK